MCATAPLTGCGSGGDGGGAAPATAEPTQADTELPADVRPGAPGELISATPLTASDGMAAWRVVYHTRDQNGADVVASGLVVTPSAGQGGPVPADGRPVVAFGHGTTGVNDACAPSRSNPPLSSIGGALGLVTQGYVLAAADYIGLGTPGEHAIYVARPEGQALLDVARAARSLPAAHAGESVVIWGYSQGGQAALAAGALAARYAPELLIRGVVTTAPLADVPNSLRSMLAEPNGVAYVLLAAIGVSVIDPGVRLSDDLTAQGRRLLSIAREKCALDLLIASSGQSSATVFVHDPLTTEPYASVFAAQRTAVIARMAPVLVLQGDIDDVIHQPVTDGVVRDLCATGTEVAYHRYAIADHSTVVGASYPEMYSWIAGRFATDPPPVPNICAGL
ncbi:lipase family protein [Pseudofrankia sp. BMG5.36]|uniref:lipase family protein n=1 Tax=Pseudofrankia sp. BMG5.36 TaxID=1834512 RepID=UPI0008DAD901|nr:lipase family protein [Pseudofrankia sp. BMG5.36]OHV44408.1 lipase [Pseudofrankia sp. BMG5.36]